MTDRELFAQAVVALEYHTQQTRSISNTNLAIEALRARLAQPEPEPVADKRLKIKLGSQYGGDLCGQWFYLTPADDNANTALTAHTGIATPPQREWQGLTNDEIMDACSAVWASHPIEVGQVVAAILKEKNGF